MIRKIGGGEAISPISRSQKTEDKKSKDEGAMKSHEKKNREPKESRRKADVGPEKGKIVDEEA